jgi:hypothetical protein
MLEKIKSHTQEVFLKKVVFNIEVCPKCNIAAPTFKLHERKKRKFYIIKEQIVTIVIGVLGRWKCIFCKKTFTYYPEWILPYKRYVTEYILSISEKYLILIKATYRNIANFIGYEDGKKSLSHSAIWYWLKFLGEQKKLLSKKLNLIRQKDSNEKIFREIDPIHQKKYCSKFRKEILQIGQRLLKTKYIYQKIFKTRFFPEFRTGEYWSYCKMSP